MSIVILFSSCKDYLNMPPKNVKVVYTMEDVREAMSLYLFALTKSSFGATISNYIFFNNRSAEMQFPFTRHINVSATLLTNDLDLSNFLDAEGTGNKNRGGYGFYSDYNECKEWNSNRLASQVWVQVFNNVGYLNMILKDLENTPDFNQETFDRVSGEARVARAYFLLTLNSIFAPADRNDLGIPFNFDADVIQGGARWKQTVLYKKLINEITEVMEYKTVPKASWNIFYNRRVMCAILAQTYLYKAGTCAAEESDLANAEMYAKEARNGERMANTIAEISELSTVPLEIVVDKPHRFALIRIALYASGPNDYSPWGKPEEKLFQYPTNELYSLYDDTDIRKQVYFKETENVVNVVRYISTNDHDINDTHVLFSYAEMLLIEAEALARQGKTSEAIVLLNDFKQSRIPGYAGYKGNNVIDEIFKERRKEFAFEGFSNWIDLKRQGAEMTRMAYDETSNSAIEYKMNKNDYRFTLPIPGDVELKYNNIPQNPGWK